MKPKKLLLITALLFLIMGACKDKGSLYETYENHDISACGVNDPLRNIEWLAESCRNIKEQKLECYIYLLKVIDKDEYVFVSSSPLQNEKDHHSVTFRNCSGDIIWLTANLQHPDVRDFLKDKEYVAELFHLIKQ